jgi:hypothetical protein
LEEGEAAWGGGAAVWESVHAGMGVVVGEKDDDKVHDDDDESVG